MTGRSTNFSIKLKERTPFCEVCSWTPPQGVNGRGLNAHHIVPVSMGGRTDQWNMIVLCPTCHRLAHVFDCPRNRPSLVNLLRRKLGLYELSYGKIYRSWTAPAQLRAPNGNAIADKITECFEWKVAYWAAFRMFRDKYGTVATDQIDFPRPPYTLRYINPGDDIDTSINPATRQTTPNPAD